MGHQRDSLELLLWTSYTVATTYYFVESGRYTYSLSSKNTHNFLSLRWFSRFVSSDQSGRLVRISSSHYQIHPWTTILITPPPLVPPSTVILNNTPNAYGVYSYFRLSIDAIVISNREVNCIKSLSMRIYMCSSVQMLVWGVGGQHVVHEEPNINTQPERVERNSGDLSCFLSHITPCALLLPQNDCPEPSSTVLPPSVHEVHLP